MLKWRGTDQEPNDVFKGGYHDLERFQESWCGGDLAPDEQQNGEQFSTSMWKPTGIWTGHSMWRPTGIGTGVKLRGILHSARLDFDRHWSSILSYWGAGQVTEDLEEATEVQCPIWQDITGFKMTCVARSWTSAYSLGFVLFLIIKQSPWSFSYINKNECSISATSPPICEILLLLSLSSSSSSNFKSPHSCDSNEVSHLIL